MLIDKYCRLTVYLMIIIVLFALGGKLGYAQNQASEEEPLISSAESLFKAMKDKLYKEIWSLLTEKTKESIVDSVVKTSAKSGYQLDIESTRNDFSSGGPLAKAYWDAYVANFNPDMVLQQSTWKLGKIKKADAEIIIQHRKADKPAILKMKKEGGIWKTGLEETFGILKWILQ